MNVNVQPAVNSNIPIATELNMPLPRMPDNYINMVTPSTDVRYNSNLQDAHNGGQFTTCTSTSTTNTGAQRNDVVCGNTGRTLSNACNTSTNRPMMNRSYCSANPATVQNYAVPQKSSIRVPLTPSTRMQAPTYPQRNNFAQLPTTVLQHIPQIIQHTQKAAAASANIITSVSNVNQNSKTGNYSVPPGGVQNPGFQTSNQMQNRKLYVEEGKLHFKVPPDLLANIIDMIEKYDGQRSSIVNMAPSGGASTSNLGTPFAASNGSSNSTRFTTPIRIARTTSFPISTSVGPNPSHGFTASRLPCANVNSKRFSSCGGRSSCVPTVSYSNIPYQSTRNVNFQGSNPIQPATFRGRSAMPCNPVVNQVAANQMSSGGLNSVNSMMSISGNVLAGSSPDLSANLVAEHNNIATPRPNIMNCNPSLQACNSKGTHFLNNNTVNSAMPQNVVMGASSIGSLHTPFGAVRDNHGDHPNAGRGNTALNVPCNIVGPNVATTISNCVTTSYAVNQPSLSEAHPVLTSHLSRIPSSGSPSTVNTIHTSSASEDCSASTSCVGSVVTSSETLHEFKAPQVPKAVRNVPSAVDNSSVNSAVEPAIPKELYEFMYSPQVANDLDKDDKEECAQGFWVCDPEVYRKELEAQKKSLSSEADSTRVVHAGSTFNGNTLMGEYPVSSSSVSTPPTTSLPPYSYPPATSPPPYDLFRTPEIVLNGGLHPAAQNKIQSPKSMVDEALTESAHLVPSGSILHHPQSNAPDLGVSASCHDSVTHTNVAIPKNTEVPAISASLKSNTEIKVEDIEEDEVMPCILNIFSLNKTNEDAEMAQGSGMKPSLNPAQEIAKEQPCQTPTENQISRSPEPLLPDDPPVENSSEAFRLSVIETVDPPVPGHEKELAQSDSNVVSHNTMSLNDACVTNSSNESKAKSDILQRVTSEAPQEPSLNPMQSTTHAQSPLAESKNCGDNVDGAMNCKQTTENEVLEKENFAVAGGHVKNSGLEAFQDEDDDVIVNDAAVEMHPPLLDAGEVETSFSGNATKLSASPAASNQDKYLTTSPFSTDLKAKCIEESERTANDANETREDGHIDLTTYQPHANANTSRNVFPQCSQSSSKDAPPSSSLNSVGDTIELIATDKQVLPDQTQRRKDCINLDSDSASAGKTVIDEDHSLSEPSPSVSGSNARTLASWLKSSRFPSSKSIPVNFNRQHTTAPPSIAKVLPRMHHPENAFNRASNSLPPQADSAVSENLLTAKTSTVSSARASEISTEAAQAPLSQFAKLAFNSTVNAECDKHGHSVVPNEDRAGAISNSSVKMTEMPTDEFKESSAAANEDFLEHSGIQPPVEEVIIQSSVVLKDVKGCSKTVLVKQTCIGSSSRDVKESTFRAQLKVKPDLSKFRLKVAQSTANNEEECRRLANGYVVLPTSQECAKMMSPKASKNTEVTESAASSIRNSSNKGSKSYGKEQRLPFSTHTGQADFRSHHESTNSSRIAVDQVQERCALSKENEGTESDSLECVTDPFEQAKKTSQRDPHRQDGTNFLAKSLENLVRDSAISQDLLPTNRVVEEALASSDTGQSDDAVLAFSDKSGAEMSNPPLPSETLTDNMKEPASLKDCRSEEFKLNKAPGIDIVSKLSEAISVDNSDHIDAMTSTETSPSRATAKTSPVRGKCDDSIIFSSENDAHNISAGCTPRSDAGFGQGSPRDIPRNDQDNETKQSQRMETTYRSLSTEFSDISDDEDTSKVPSKNGSSGDDKNVCSEGPLLSSLAAKFIYRPESDDFIRNDSETTAVDAFSDDEAPLVIDTSVEEDTNEDSDSKQKVVANERGKDPSRHLDSVDSVERWHCLRSSSPNSDTDSRKFPQFTDIDANSGVLSHCSEFVDEVTKSRENAEKKEQPVIEDRNIFDTLNIMGQESAAESVNKTEFSPLKNFAILPTILQEEAISMAENEAKSTVAVTACTEVDTATQSPNRYDESIGESGSIENISHSSGESLSSPTILDGGNESRDREANISSAVPPTLSDVADAEGYAKLRHDSPVSSIEDSFDLASKKCSSRSTETGDNLPQSSTKSTNSNTANVCISQEEKLNSDDDTVDPVIEQDEAEDFCEPADTGVGKIAPGVSSSECEGFSTDDECLVSNNNIKEGSSVFKACLLTPKRRPKSVKLINLISDKEAEKESVRHGKQSALKGSDKRKEAVGLLADYLASMTKKTSGSSVGDVRDKSHLSPDNSHDSRTLPESLKDLESLEIDSESPDQSRLPTSKIKQTEPRAETAECLPSEDFTIDNDKNLSKPYPRDEQPIPERPSKSKMKRASDDFSKCTPSGKYQQSSNRKEQTEHLVRPPGRLPTTDSTAPNNWKFTRPSARDERRVKQVPLSNKEKSTSHDLAKDATSKKADAIVVDKSRKLSNRPMRVEERSTSSVSRSMHEKGKTEKSRHSGQPVKHMEKTAVPSRTSDLLTIGIKKGDSSRRSSDLKSGSTEHNRSEKVAKEDSKRNEEIPSRAPKRPHMPDRKSSHQSVKAKKGSAVSSCPKLQSSISNINESRSPSYSHPSTQFREKTSLDRPVPNSEKPPRKESHSRPSQSYDTTDKRDKILPKPSVHPKISDNDTMSRPLDLSRYSRMEKQSSSYNNREVARKSRRHEKPFRRNYHGKADDKASQRNMATSVLTHNNDSVTIDRRSDGTAPSETSRVPQKRRHLEKAPVAKDLPYRDVDDLSFSRKRVHEEVQSNSGDVIIDLCDTSSSSEDCDKVDFSTSHRSKKRKRLDESISRTDPVPLSSSFRSKVPKLPVENFGLKSLKSRSSRELAVKEKKKSSFTMKDKSWDLKKAKAMMDVRQPSLPPSRITRHEYPETKSSSNEKRSRYIGPDDRSC